MAKLKKHTEHMKEITERAAQAAEADLIKTTIKVPRELWALVYGRALRDRCDMNLVVTAALRTYLGGRS